MKEIALLIVLIVFGCWFTLGLFGFFIHHHYKEDSRWRWRDLWVATKFIIFGYISLRLAAEQAVSKRERGNG